jgi:hypothetical protein
LTRLERESGLFFEFNMDTLLRGDFETRMKGFATGIQWGIISPNEARAKDNWNPYEGGDEYLVPLNMQSIAQLGESEPESITETVGPNGERSTTVQLQLRGTVRADVPPELRDLPATAQRSVQSRWRLREVFERLLLEAASRLVSAEVRAIRKALAEMPARGEAAFRDWLAAFFIKHEEFAREVMGPPLLAYMEAVSGEVMDELSGDPADFRADLEAFHADYVATFGKRYAGEGSNQLLKLLDAAETEEAAIGALTERLDSWAELGAGKIALKESAQAMNAISSAAYIFAGVTVLRWVWNGGTCGICPHLHGKAVEIGRPFVSPGDTIGPGDGSTTDYVVKQVRNHPPLHRGCICTVAPG